MKRCGSDPFIDLVKNTDTSKSGGREAPKRIKFRVNFNEGGFRCLYMNLNVKIVTVIFLWK